METFSALLALCVGNSPVTGEFPAQKPVTQSFDVFFDLRLNNPLSKQSRDWWFETPSCSLWRHGNEYISVNIYIYMYQHKTVVTTLRWHCSYHSFVLIFGITQNCGICSAIAPYHCHDLSHRYADCVVGKCDYGLNVVSNVCICVCSVGMSMDVHASG